MSNINRLEHIAKELLQSIQVMKKERDKTLKEWDYVSCYNCWDVEVLQRWSDKYCQKEDEYMRTCRTSTDYPDFEEQMDCVYYFID